jgi:effector-binding domain-containing protein
LHRILALKDLGLSLAQIDALLNADEELPTAQLRGMLQLKQVEVERGIAEEQMRLRRISVRLDQIEQFGKPSPHEIVVKSVAPLAVASVRVQVPHMAEMGIYCERLTNQVYAALKQRKIRPIQPELMLYHTDEYRETDVDVEAAVAVSPRHLAQTTPSDALTLRELPGHTVVASLIYEGDFSDMTPAVLELLRWVAGNGYVPSGPLREIHLSGPAHLGDADPEEAVTELMLPIAPAHDQAIS